MIGNSTEVTIKRIKYMKVGA